MSILQMNDMRYYWKSYMFTGHIDFKTTMSHDDFSMIRSHVALQDTSQFTNEHAVQDPMWHCQKWLEYFQQKSAEIAVPLGTSALDEASCRTKARTQAKSYIANKPD
jgi:Transposase IS4